MTVRELAYCQTALGALTLRRRTDPRLANSVVYEVKLGDEYLMSSNFTESERRMVELAFALTDQNSKLDVVVGGLGLGYTARATLDEPRVASLLVIDLFDELIGWHRDGLVPLGNEITSDPRCDIRQGDFFELARTSLDQKNPARRFDVVLVDIDHTPEHHLDPANESFYRTESLQLLRQQMTDGGVFALWSDARADATFTDHLADIFGHAEGHDIEFPNPYTGGISANSVYLAKNTR